jgi:ribosomal protein S4
MNIKLRKRRYKPLYKKLLGLKKNVQNRLKLLSFKKKKWQKFIEHLKKTSYNKKYNFRFYDQSCDYVSKFQSQFKWNFKNLLQSKKRFTYFYGQLLQKYIEIQFRLAKKKRKVLNPKYWIFSKILVNFFERRLDTILYRSHFAYSIRHAKQLISHKYIQVNGKTINLSSYKIKNGDSISLTQKKKVLLNKNNLTYLLSSFWPIPQDHLQINYQTYQIIFVENLNINSIILMFPFHLKWN